MLFFLTGFKPTEKKVIHAFPIISRQGCLSFFVLFLVCQV